MLTAFFSFFIQSISVADFILRVGMGFIQSFQVSSQLRFPWDKNSVKPIRLVAEVSLLPLCERHGGLMVSALDHGASGPGSSSGWGHCVVFLGNTLHSHSASLHPGV